MNVISREELKAKIDQGDEFKLVMTMGEWAFKAAHIPGSLNISSEEQGQKLLSEEDEIVVYCSDVACMASQAAYRNLINKGFKNVRRYAGGLADWEEAGYTLERFE